MNHSGHSMDHSGHTMDHSGHTMDHSGHTVDHSGHTVDHSGHTVDHSGHEPGAADVAAAVLNATLSAVTTAASQAASAVLHGSGDSGHDHAAMGHDRAAMGHDHAAMGHDHAAMGEDHSQHMATAGAAGHAAHNMAGGHSMAMTFHFGVSEFILFDAWHVTSAGGMVASCLGLFILALLYEGLKYKREDLLRKNATRNQFDTIRVPTEGGVTEVTSVSNSRSAVTAADTGDQPSSETASDVTTEREPITAAGRSRQARQRMLSKHHFLQTFLHAVQVVIGYFLMLAFMTYNVWVGIAVVLGAAAGYFIFGSKKFVVVDVTEHCH